MPTRFRPAFPSMGGWWVGPSGGVAVTALLGGAATRGRVWLRLPRPQVWPEKAPRWCAPRGLPLCRDTILERGWPDGVCRGETRRGKPAPLPPPAALPDKWGDGFRNTA